MPKITVNGVSRAYEIVGGEGPSIALTPAGPEPGGIAMVKERNKLLAERLSKLGFKILIWDRRNSGESDVSIEGEPSEWELYADDLHALLNELGMVPTYASGGSGGYLVSLILAHRHPEDVKGLPLRSPMTGDLEVWNRLANNRYLQPAEEAENNGMKAAIENTIWGKVVEQNIANRERWSEWDLSGRGHVGGLSDEELRQITTPATFIPDAVQNDAHPRSAAEKLQKLLPMCCRTWYLYTPDRRHILRKCQYQQQYKTRSLKMSEPIYKLFIMKPFTPLQFSDEENKNFREKRGNNLKEVGGKEIVHCIGTS